MNCTKKVLLILLPIIILFCGLSAHTTYADIKVNIKEEKTEPYSNKKDSDTVIIKNEEKTPLNNTETSSLKTYESEVDREDDSSSKKTKNTSTSLPPSFINSPSTNNPTAIKNEYWWLNNILKALDNKP